MAAKRFHTRSSLYTMELFAMILLLSLSACTADNGPSPRFQSQWVNSPNSDGSKSFYMENQDYEPQYYRVHDSSPNILFVPAEGEYQEYSVNPEFDQMQPYARDVSSRSVQPKLFQPICPALRRTVHLTTEHYEYRPSFYEETICMHSFHPDRPYERTRNKVCSAAGFSCIQHNRTVFFSRRPTNVECWESEARNISVACECMWPYHELGDILNRH